MPIKKTTEPGTDIYQRYKVATKNADGTYDPPAAAELFREVMGRQAYGHDHRLEMTEEACAEILSSDSPGSHIANSCCRAEFIRDVKSARDSCGAIRDMLSRDDAEGAVNEAILLGRAIERAGVRALEPNAMTGGKVLAGSRKGAAMVNLSSAEIKSRNADICRRWQVVSAENPHLYTKKGIDEIVAKEFSLGSYKTVERVRCKGSRKKRKK